MMMIKATLCSTAVFVSHHGPLHHICDVIALCHSTGNGNLKNRCVQNFIKVIKVHEK